MRRLNDILERALLVVCGALFALLNADVALQVLGRSVFRITTLWTLDVAQLLFTWCIFLGAAVALRRGGHYFVTLLPDRFARANAVLKLGSDAAVGCVVLVMLIGGWEFAQLGRTLETETLPMTQLWFYLPVFASGVAMTCFLIEVAGDDLRALAAAWRDAGRSETAA